MTGCLGEEVVVEPAGTITGNGRSLPLDGVIYINQYVKTTGFEGVDIAANGGLLVWKSAVTEEEAVYGEQDELVEGLKALSGEYMAQTEGVAAKAYSDTIFACAKFTDTEGNVHYSDVVAYSPEYYANNQINKNTKPNLVALVKAMVTYGEYAAQHFAK